MNRDDEAALEARRRALGAVDPRCSVPGCPESDPRALTGAHPSILCADHRAEIDGRRSIEEHHVAGQHNSPATAWLPANRHAVLTFMQQTAWRTELLRNPDVDPLLCLEAAVRGSRETIGEILDGVLAPIEAELRDQRAFLAATFGPDWCTAYQRWRTERPDAP
ncbi:MAG: hypothetical protein ACYDAK_02945 [Candidatus Limnocylindrales bacterium]